MAISNEQLFAFIKKNPIGVGCGVLSLLIAGGIYFRKGEGPAVSAQLAEKNDRRDRLSLNVKNSAQLEEQFAELTKANKAIQDRLISAKNKFPNIGYISGLARDAEVKLLGPATDSSPKAPSKNGFVMVPFTVNVQGSFEQIMDFLRRVEYGQHYSRITYLAVNKAAGEGSANQLTLNLNLEILGRP